MYVQIAPLPYPGLMDAKGCSLGEAGHMVAPGYEVMRFWTTLAVGISPHEGA